MSVPKFDLPDIDAPTAAVYDLPAQAATATATTQWSLGTWIALVFVLALLGLNVFAVLAKGTEAGVWLFQTFVVPLLSMLGLETLYTTRQILKTGGEGAKAAAQGGAVALEAGADVLDAGATLLSKPKKPRGVGGGKDRGNSPGWCFVGNDAAGRICAEVGAADTCMSGDVFPTQDVCINPSLRA